jgi:LacI family transcriptional regulator
MSVTTPPGSSWRRGVALTLDQNTRQHAQLAIDLMLRHLESGYQPQTYADGKVDFILYSAENVD